MSVVERVSEAAVRIGERVLPAPADERSVILANLHLHAVLPRLQELVKLDPEARELADRIDMSVRFVVRDGPFVTVRLGGGTAEASLAADAPTDVGLYFVSCNQLNAMFQGKQAVPIPYKGLTKLSRMRLFTQLTDKLTRYLEPKEEDLKDPDFRAKHVEMLLMTGLSGTADIARLDHHMKKVVAKLPKGTILFHVAPNGPTAHVIVDEYGIRAGSGPIADPSATLQIEGMDVALGVLTNKIDTFAALGAETLRASGLLPLVDEFNALLDRVGHYLAK